MPDIGIVKINSKDLSIKVSIKGAGSVSVKGWENDLLTDYDYGP